MTADRVLCPLTKKMGDCKKKVKPGSGADRPAFIVCGFYSEGAGKCSVGLPAEALRQVYEMLDGVEPALREAGLEYEADDVAEVDAALLELIAGASLTPTPPGEPSEASDASDASAANGAD